MTEFGNYSRYYDLLYRDKNYAEEVDYIDTLIQRYSAQARNVLNLGCGTGRHDFLLAEKGYVVTGVDRSESMLVEATNQLKELQSKQPDVATRVSFCEGDIRDTYLGKKYEVVLSLFHVMSYQVTNDDFRQALLTVKRHLDPGGIFIFDFWYGPAVLTDRPEVRVKRLEDEKIRVTRIAEPVMHPNRNVVDVKYQLFIEDKDTGRTEVIEELHSMRYIFDSELEIFLEQAGFEVLDTFEYMTGQPLSYDTWNACYVAKSV